MDSRDALAFEHSSTLCPCPNNTENHEHSRYYRLGREAARLGAVLNDNPFAVGIEAHEAWRDGWQKAWGHG